MSSPRPRTPFDAPHDHHDALLIAQLVAGDALEPVQLHEARQLVSTCPECATLAADLRAVPGVVAWWPLPPRRRDFRLDARQAEQLRGSRWSRLLRRLSVPASGSLRPVAAGVMSLGLVLVVAGSVWPAPEEPTAPQPAVAPQASALADEAPVTMATSPAARPTSPAAGAPLERMSLETPADDGAALDAEIAPMRDALASGSSEERVLGDSGNSAKASSGPARERDTSFEEHVDSVAEAPVGDLPADDHGLLAPPASPVAERLGDTSAEAPAGSMALEAAAPTEDTLEQAAATEPAALEIPVAPAPGTDAAPEADSAAGTTEVAPEATAPATTFDVDSALIWVGAILAVGSAIVLLLAWLSRRASDPLLR